VVVTGPATNAGDFAQLVAWLRANPAKAAYGIPSNGTIPHFAGTRIEAALNLPMTRVPYRGGAAVVKDVIGGHLPFAVITLADALPSHQAGTVRILAVSSEKRSPYLPDVPTLKESGIELVADSWYGMWLPAGASPDFVRQLSAAVVTVLAKPEVKEKLLAVGLIPVGTTPQGLSHELAANTAFWRPIVQATGYRIGN
jgi:tripartite-type tricarboxylate transporter receptor subunit TctC